MAEEGEKAYVTNIQRFSINDGPGIRTTVFLKGCALNCAWCHNPECIDFRPEIYWKQSLCRQCGRCFDVCPQGAIQPPVDLGSEDDGRLYHKIDREKCNRCMRCVEACIYDALMRVGERMSVEEVLEEVERDLPFYTNSEGGLTVTGGEPTSFPLFTLALLREARNRGIHTCLDTSGFCSWEVLNSLRPHVDIFLYDIKCLSGKLHLLRTGVSNSPILANLARLAQEGEKIIVRVPVIPGFNDSLEQMGRIAEFLETLKPALLQVDILPFHNWCQDKYRWLGRAWEFEEVESLSEDDVDDFREILEGRGIKTTIGG